MKRQNLFSIRIILTFLLGIVTLSISAQNLTVRGTVTDNSREPIIGATIIIEGDASRGTVTDVDGNYVLNNVPSNAHLQFTYVGMRSQVIPVDGRTTINLVMEEDSEMLSEVVVTALGITKQARSVGYATTSVSTAEIERVNAINPITALQGKVAGLNINATGASGVTSSSSITIRGAKSIDKNNSPIFVIDGMIIQEPLRGALDGTDWGSQLKNLNPADYESVTVLKGAAATALYGSRGANGAIVIVSKGGRYGKQGLGVEISQILETNDIYKSPIELQNVYGAGGITNGYEGGFLADGSLQRTAVSFGPRMDGSMVNQYLPNGIATPFVPQPDNWRSLYQAGLNSTTNFAINGGGENSSFRVSYAYTDNNGVFKRNKFSRHSISFRGLTDLNHIFSIEAGVNYAFSRAQNGANQGGWNWGGNLGMMSTYHTPRNLDLAAYESMYRDPITHAVETDSPWGTLRGYLHNRDMNLDQRSENSLLSTLTLRAKIAPKLTASIKGNYNYYGISTMYKGYGQGANYGPTGSGAYSRGGNISGAYNFLGMLQSTDNEFNLGGEVITVDAILAAELYGNTPTQEWRKETNGGLVSPAVFAFSNSVNRITPTFTYNERGSQQAFGLSAILNFAWRDQLFLELTGRNDWLSTLTYPSYMTTGMNNYTVFYPSANASWVFSETLDMPDWLSFGKLRASLSRVGMGTAAYATTQGFGVFSQSAQYDPNRESVLIANPNLGTAWNNDLKPEVQQSIELGTDLRFFNERFNIDFAYYKTNTFNQILRLGAVTESGASQQLINAGNIQNQGVELMVEATPLRTADLRWTVGSNFTLNRGKIVELHPNVKEWQLMGQYDGGPEIWAYEGGGFGVITTPYNNAYGAAIARFNNEDNPNDPRNGKPLISYWGAAGNPNSVPVYGYTTNYDMNIPERVEIGKVEPDFLLSFNTSFSYKDFDFYALIDGRVGGNFFSNTYKYASSMGTLQSSLYGRDQENGGWQRTNYKGETVHDVYPLDGVFQEGATAPLASDPSKRIDVAGLTYKEALDKGIRPMPAGAYYTYNYGWGMPAELGLQDNTWFALREVTLGYRLPEKVLNKIGANYFRIGLTARNLGYLVNKLTDGLNPMSISNNNPLTPHDIGAVPFSRTYALNFTVRF